MSGEMSQIYSILGNKLNLQPFNQGLCFEPLIIQTPRKFSDNVEKEGLLFCLTRNSYKYIFFEWTSYRHLVKTIWIGLLESMQTSSSYLFSGNWENWDLDCLS